MSDKPENNAGGSGDAGGSGADDQGQDQGLVFDNWYKAQDEKVRQMLDGHVSGLKTTLETERNGRKSFEKQLRELAGKAEKGSEAEKRLTEMADQMTASERRSDFYEQAHSEGVTNLKLAFVVAEQEELIDAKGRVNFVEMKKRYPELFGAGKPKPPGGQGAGTGGQTPGRNVNDFIRAASGRTTGS